jgi:hypothetical protein
MKKIAFIAAILLSLTVNLHAQDIYKAILNDAKTIVNDPSGNPVLRKIAQFKVSDLQYIHDKAIASPHEVTTKFLDDQAYYMNQFINTFIREALVNTSLTKADKKKRILLFMDASSSNPLFNDEDKELVNAYINDSKNQFTPFCLDTDWTKAYAAVMSKLNEK